MFSSIKDAIEDIKMGKMVIIVDDEDRENEGDFYIPAEYATPQAINFMITHGKGLVCMPIRKDMADRLGFENMVVNNTDRKETAFTISVDHVDATTGISAYERSLTIRTIIDVDSKKEDFTSPGHIFPLIAKEKGVLERRGHTEASVDLSRLAGFKPAGVICEIIKEDGSMARVDDLFEMAKEFDMKIITIEDLVEYIKQTEALVKRVASADMPTEHGTFEIVGYEDLVSGKEHIALVKGDVANCTPIVRIHSECLTGDVLGSLRCDCGKQLEMAMKEVEKNGCGVIIYLRQEGRGIGLLNKLKAYSLQDGGMDTVEANLALGFDEDMREYDIAYSILKDLGVEKISLMTNNPEKVEGVQKYGMQVEQIKGIEIKSCSHNHFYLKTKKEKMGHTLKEV